MLHLRLSAAKQQAPKIERALAELPGIKRLSRAEGLGSDETILSADVHRQAADRVVDKLEELGVSDEDFVLLRADVVAPSVTHEVEGSDSFSWLEVLGEARANSRPFGRYIGRMAAAGVIAGVGVMTRNPILIVGGMALSPDLLPVSAACVGIVLRRAGLAIRALVTLALGLAVMILVVIAVTALVMWANWLPNEENFWVGDGGMRTLVTLHFSMIAVALAAGVVAMLSFETHAASAVGVAISVTTVPAAAFFGVAVGAGESRGSAALEALVTLGVNVAILLAVGSLTLIVQRHLTARFRDRRRENRTA